SGLQERAELLTPSWQPRRRLSMIHLRMCVCGRIWVKRTELAGEGLPAHRIGGRVVTASVHKIGKHIGGAQQQFYEIARGRHPAGTQMIKDALECVREMYQIAEVEGPGPTLDRMDRPKDGVHRLRVRVAILNSKKSGLQFAKLLFALLEERLFNCCHRINEKTPSIAGYAETRWIASTSLIGSNGLTIQPVAP